MKWCLNCGDLNDEKPWTEHVWRRHGWGEVQSVLGEVHLPVAVVNPQRDPLWRGAINDLVVLRPCLPPRSRSYSPEYLRNLVLIKRGCACETPLSTLFTRSRPIKANSRHSFCFNSAIKIRWGKINRQKSGPGSRCKSNFLWNCNNCSLMC